MLTNLDKVRLPARPAITRRPDVAVRAATTLAFTGLQAWAMVLVVQHVALGGAARVALAAALAAAVVTVLDAWREAWRVAGAPARPAARHRHPA
jgi:hypothetical protein